MAVATEGFLPTSVDRQRSPLVKIRKVTGALLGVVGSLLAFPRCVPPQQGGTYGALGATCPQLTSSGDPMHATFGAQGKAEATVRAFVAASKDLAEVTAQMEAEVFTACRNIGHDIGVTDAELQGPDVRGVCGAVSAKVDAILAAGAKIEVRATPPECRANANAKAECSGACDVQVDPGEIVAQCDPGKLSGKCEGRCVGRCEGVCRGECNGKCEAQNASGQCDGRCDGKCNGECDATCHARCEGEWVAPKCEGHVRPPSASGECAASCEARAEIRAECTPANVQIEANQAAGDLAALAASLQANLPALIQAQFKLSQQLASSAKVLVEVSAELPEVVGKASLEAGACVAASASAVAQASARVDVSIQASASVTGRAGATI